MRSILAVVLMSVSVSCFSFCPVFYEFDESTPFGNANDILMAINVCKIKDLRKLEDQVGNPVTSIKTDLNSTTIIKGHEAYEALLVEIVKLQISPDAHKGCPSLQTTKIGPRADGVWRGEGIATFDACEMDYFNFARRASAPSGTVTEVWNVHLGPVDGRTLYDELRSKLTIVNGQ